ncbi:hypothetical protein L4D76_25560 [Photobacterium sagamiensis]|uniref:hypothetical protein n=1 Tax=Photobacterium sagamiensis TaxID=2910241 RepID=UPI003D0DFB38
MKPYEFNISTITGLSLLALSPGLAAAPQTHIQQHTFSVMDVQGGKDNATYATDQSILCGMADSVHTSCPDGGPQPQTDREGVTLYPIENNFGFIVSDFVGAAPRIFDEDYAEGFAGNVTDETYGDGLALANSETNLFKTRDPYGTWCTGVGGVTVKCSSEHYVAMEHVLSCNESVPYSTIDPSSSVQRDLLDPATGEIIDNCANNTLSDVLKIVRDFEETDESLTSTVPGVQMEANESTVQHDIAVGKDYSITLKDDGKPLYRWGNAIKRPIDIRVYAQMPLPQLWKDNPGTPYTVTSATLTITHSITNNPNDQIRPEDMENEAATGRLPGYLTVGSNWQSARDCYEGDGDFIPAGTLYKNAGFEQPDAFSSDLKSGMTNAWYTSIDRDPFEAGVSDAGEQEVGPRWRLKANKYGQDVPSLEIANASSECNTPPPFDKDDQKYAKGSNTSTTIDLLDFDGPSPLATSRGWIDASQNSINLGANGLPTEGNGMSINGLPLTDDFDLAVYVKGDKKAVKIFHAELTINWDDDLLEDDL